MPLLLIDALQLEVALSLPKLILRLLEALDTNGPHKPCGSRAFTNKLPALLKHRTTGDHFPNARASTNPRP